MKVLHLVPSFKRRGAELFAYELISALSAKSFENLLVGLYSGADEIGIVNSCDTKTLYPKRRCFGRIKALREEIESFGPDIVLAHGGQPLKFAVLAKKKGTKPKIIYRKIGLSEQWLGKWRTPKVLFYRWLISQADFVIAVGESLVGELHDLFMVNSQKIYVIPNATDPTRFNLQGRNKEKIRQKLGIENSTSVLVSVGALSWEKNQEAMLRILKVVKKAVPQTLLFLVGNGPVKPQLERLATELGVADNVRFLGLRQDIPDLLAASDIFLLTSFTEGVPGVLIEAGMAGLPSVTWDVAGAKEVVQDRLTGSVTPYNNESAFAAAVIQIINDYDLRSKMGAAAQIFCCEKFSMDRCVSEHIELFENVLTN